MAQVDHDASTRVRTLVVGPGEPLYIEPLDNGGQLIVGDDPLRADDLRREGLQGLIDEGLSLAGAWSDLDYDEMMDSLDRIRRDSKPSRPSPVQ